MLVLYVGYPGALVSYAREPLQECIPRTGGLTFGYGSLVEPDTASRPPVVASNPS